MKEMDKARTLNNVHVVFIGRNMSELKPLAMELAINEHVTLIEELGFDSHDHEFKIPREQNIQDG